MDNVKVEALTQKQVDALVIAACAGAPVTESQLVRFVKRAKDALIVAGLVELAIKGEVKVDVRNDDPDKWMWSEREARQ